MPHDTDVLPDTDNGAVTSTSEARNAGTSPPDEGPVLGQHRRAAGGGGGVHHHRCAHRGALRRVGEGLALSARIDPRRALKRGSFSPCPPHAVSSSPGLSRLGELAQRTLRVVAHVDVKLRGESGVRGLALGLDGPSVERDASDLRGGQLESRLLEDGDACVQKGHCTPRAPPRRPNAIAVAVLALTG